MKPGSKSPVRKPAAALDPFAALLAEMGMGERDSIIEMEARARNWSVEQRRSVARVFRKWARTLDPAIAGLGRSVEGKPTRHGSILEDELREVAGYLSPEECRKLGVKLKRWAGQLARYAKQMKGRVALPGLPRKLAVLN